MSKIKLSNGSLSVEVHATIVVGAGMDHRKIADMELAQVSRDGTVIWRDGIKLSPRYVEDRYNFAEELLGAKDASFCAATLSLSR